jgi:hypothetical protein
MAVLSHVLPAKHSKKDKSTTDNKTNGHGRRRRRRTSTHTKN